jgi:hypothetical protein
MSHTDMGIVGATTDTFILFENGVRRNRLVLPGLSNAADHTPSKPDPPTALSLSETLSGWRLTENRAMLLRDERSFQAHWLGGCRSIAVAGSARGRDLDIAAANKRSAADCS